MNPWGVDCNEFVEMVTEYLEGTLGEDDRVRFEQHLTMCGSCRDYLEQIRLTLRATGKLRTEDVPAEGMEPLLKVFRKWKQGRS
ncbi:MAG TPA: zf-HC2 domain-containing protein [Patescibacteria group bacterium]|nr:zf-HC2 domain-containing protein [Patescibacteria group bacterium]